MEAKFILLVALFCLGLKSVTPKIPPSEVQSLEAEIKRLQSLSPADLSSAELDDLNSMMDAFVELRVAEMVEERVISHLEKRSEIVPDEANRNKRAVKKVAKIAPKEESPDVNSSPSLLEQLEMLAETAELERIVNSTAEKILSERIPSDIESAIRKRRATTDVSAVLTIKELGDMIVSVNILKSERLISKMSTEISGQLKQEGILDPK